MADKRPPIKISFQYNVTTGEIEEFLIDDNAANAPDAYHDDVANMLLSHMGIEGDIEDAGSRANLYSDRNTQSTPQSDNNQERDTNDESH